MNQEEFDKRMQEIDTELIKKGIPVENRRLEALKLFCPNSSFSLSPLDKKFFEEFEGPNLFDKIRIWYQDMYSKKTLSNFDIGRKSFKLRGEIYYINYPTVYGEYTIDVLNCVEDLTEKMKCSLNQVEQEQILQEFELGYHAFNAIRSLAHFLEYLHEEAKGLVVNGVGDIKTSASNINDNDIQGTIFRSHQAAEKFLKALWVELDYHNAVVKKYDRGKDGLKMCGHHLIRLYERLPKTQPKKNKIHKQVIYLHELVPPDMDIRYKIQGKSLDEAVQAVNSMLIVCKFVSEQIANIHKNTEIFSIQEYEEGLVKIYLDKFISLGVKANQGQDITTDIDNAVRECTEHLAIVKSSTEIGNLKQLIGKIKLILSDWQYSQQHKEWSDTLNKVLKLLELRIAEIEK
jgi:signal peptidase I